MYREYYKYLPPLRFVSKCMKGGWQVKRKVIGLIVTLLLFLIFFCAGFIYLMVHPSMEIRTEIKPIDDETYQSLGALEYVEHPEQQNFRNLLFTFKFKYSNAENIRTEMSKSFKELLTSDVYWVGEDTEYDDIDHNEYIVKQDIVLYMGEVSEDELVDLLNDGVFTVTWEEDGKEMRDEFNIGETVLFID